MAMATRSVAWLDTHRQMEDDLYRRGAAPLATTSRPRSQPAHCEPYRHTAITVRTNFVYRSTDVDRPWRAHKTQTPLSPSGLGGLCSVSVDREGRGTMSASTPATFPRWLANASGALSLLGLVGLLLALAFGFETPNAALITAALLIFAAPLAAVWHFAVTRTLTPTEKRVWIRELTGANAFSAIAEYMRSPDLRAGARRRSGPRQKRGPNV